MRSKRDIVREIKRRFLEENRGTVENSTIHGMTTLMKNDHTVVQIMWIIFIAASASYCFYSIYNCFAEYFLYHTETQVDLNYVNEIVFPMVKICRTDLNMPNIGLKMADKVQIMATNIFFSNLYSGLLL